MSIRQPNQTTGTGAHAASAGADLHRGVADQPCDTVRYKHTAGALKIDPRAQLRWRAPCGQGLNQWKNVIAF